MKAYRRAPFRSATMLSLAAIVALSSGCQAVLEEKPGEEHVQSDPNERFTEAAYGVKASPRVTTLKKVPKGGGREQVGRPYKVKGKWYYPKEQPGYSKVGSASWYGASFHGRLTANGEVYDMFGLSAAHPTFPLPSYARVTNLENGSSVLVRVNDRGPYVSDRITDLSSKAAEMIGYKHDGVGRVKLEYVGRAPLDGDDTPTLMASYRPGSAAPSANDGLPSGVMLAMNGGGPTSGVASLPGVRPASLPAATAETSIDAIINGAVPGPKRAPNRPGDAALLASAYAPEAIRPQNGAAAALAALATPAVEAERIEIGAIDGEVLDAVRAIIASRGRLVAESDGATTVYAAVLGQGQDPDAVLRLLWGAGAGDSFALRR